ncbi:MAG: efflux RND transporter periplasmic adaptor subunit [Candidatus Latescibacteria bacterium]|jgi:RND family efflux transporter MFP subunit|nr:efflux RND transporter periplasmic adaptor subunit [Candidatus Latescibacterota bacterium]
MNRKIYLPILVLCVGIMGAFALVKSRGVVQTKPPEIPPPLVRIQTAQTTDLQLIVSAQGTVAPRTESTLIAQVAGQTISVSPAFVNGGFFEKGDVLLTIDPRDYEVAVAQAQVQVAQAKLRLAREKEEADIAREEWKLLGKGAPTDLVLRKPQIAEARAIIAAAEGSLQRAKLNLERSQIRAPYAGRVRAKNADIGQYVNPGSPVGRIYAVDYAEVRLPVPDNQLAYLELPLAFRNHTAEKPGPDVRLHAEFAGKQHTWQGQIVRVEGEIDARSRMITLVARVDNPYGQSENSNRPPLSVGMFVTAEILGNRVSNVVVVPRAALRGKDQILVVTDNRLYYRTINILRANAENVVIKSGLNSGDHICISPLDTVVEGMRVRTIEENEQALAQFGGAK